MLAFVLITTFASGCFYKIDQPKPDGQEEVYPRGDELPSIDEDYRPQPRSLRPREDPWRQFRPTAPASLQDESPPEAQGGDATIPRPPSIGPPVTDVPSDGGISRQIKQRPEVSHETVDRQASDPTGGSANDAPAETVQAHAPRVPLRGWTGGRIFAGTDSDEADRLIADIRSRDLGWVIGPGEDSHFQVAAAGSRSRGMPLVVYYRDGREIGRVEHYYGSPNELNAILGKHPAYTGHPPPLRRVGTCSMEAGDSCRSKDGICVWNDSTGRWECH
jgi:hypothetical protein